MEPLWPLYLKSDDNDNNAASHDPLETVSDFTTSIMNLYRGVRGSFSATAGERSVLQRYPTGAGCSSRY